MFETQKVLRLVEDLDAEDERVRAKVLKQLKDNPRLIETLGIVLKDAHKDVALRQRAAKALGLTENPQAIPFLIDVLRDNDAAVRTAGEEALWHIRQAPGEVRGAVVQALEQTKNPLAILYLWPRTDDAADVARTASDSLGQIGTARIVESLSDTLRYSAVGYSRNEAAQILGLVKDPRAVEPLIAASQEKGWENRQVAEAAATALGEIGSAAVEPLIVALRDPDNAMRAVPARLLGQIEDPRAVEPLIVALRDADWVVRLAAAKALGQIKDPRAVEPLIAALGDPNSYVRQEVAKALGQIEDPLAVEPLIAALGDKDENIRLAAARALEGLGWQPKDETQQAALFVGLQAWDKAAKLGPAAVEPLIWALHYNLNKAVRVAVATALGQIKDPRAIEPLIVTLYDPDKDIHVAVVTALGEMGSAAVKPLVAVLRDQDVTVCRSAAAVLGKLGDPRAVEPLIVALRDPNQAVRLTAATALGQIKDPRAVELLIAILRDPDWYVRQAAAIALGEIKDPRAVEPLIAALGDPDSYVRQEVARALGQIKDPRVAELLQTTALLVPGPSRALDVLIQMGDTHAIRPLIQIGAIQELYEFLYYNAKNATIDDLQAAAEVGSVIVHGISAVCASISLEYDAGLLARQLARQELLRRERENGSEHVQEYKSESKQNLDPERAAAQAKLVQLLQTRARQLTAEMPKPRPRSTDGKQDHEPEREEAAWTLVDWLALTSHDGQTERESR